MAKKPPRPPRVPHLAATVTDRVRVMADLYRAISEPQPPIAPATDLVADFISLTHASLTAYGVRFVETGEAPVGEQDVLVGAVTYDDGTVTLRESMLTLTALTPSTTYRVWVQTVMDEGDLEIRGPWSDTGDDYVA